jgi:carboxyl-terminal processing protease
LGTVVLISALPAHAAEQQLPALSLQERAYMASRIYESLNFFAHWQGARNLDIDAAYRAYLNRALAAEDRVAFSRATMAFLAKLNNAHTVVIDRPLLEQSGGLPFVAQWVQGKWIVTESMTPGLSAGDELASIDGHSFEEFFQQCRPLISASTERGARHMLFAREPDVPFYAHLFPAQFDLVLTDGRKVHVDRRPIRTTPPVTEGRWLKPGTVAYIRIRNLMGEQFEKRAIELAKEFHEARTLIVDVRGEPGGQSPSDLIAFLMDRPYPWWTESTPVAMPYFRLRAAQGQWEYQPFSRPDLVWSSGPQTPPQEHFAGKLIFLVDGGCYSACEDLVMPFKQNHRALIVGEATGGSTGQPAMVDLGKGLVVLVGAKREIFPDGTPFEGVGIQPDVEVRPSAADLRAGRDTELEAALRLAQ